MTHTPGPWGVLRGKEIVVVYTPFRGSEDELSSFISLHNGAPDMLEALETIMDIGDKACRDIARAAIKKARGEE
jgi:hypothetical protein